MGNRRTKEDKIDAFLAGVKDAILAGDNPRFEFSKTVNVEEFVSADLQGSVSKPCPPTTFVITVW